MSYGRVGGSIPESLPWGCLTLMGTPLVNVRVPRVTAEWWSRAAALRGVDRSALIREAMEAFVPSPGGVPPAGSAGAPPALGAPGADAPSMVSPAGGARLVVAGDPGLSGKDASRPGVSPAGRADLRSVAAPVVPIRPVSDGGRRHHPRCDCPMCKEPA